MLHSVPCSLNSRDFGKSVREGGGRAFESEKLAGNCFYPNARHDEVGAATEEALGRGTKGGEEAYDERNGGKGIGGAPERNRIGSFAVRAAAVHVEAEAVGSEKLSRAMDGDADEEHVADCREVEEVVLNCASSRGRINEERNVETETAEIHERAER